MELELTKEAFLTVYGDVKMTFCDGANGQYAYTGKRTPFSGTVIRAVIGGPTAIMEDIVIVAGEQIALRDLDPVTATATHFDGEETSYWNTSV